MPASAFPPETRFEVPDDVVYRDVGGETMILHLEAATYFGLDAVGSRVWQLLEQGRSLAEAAGMLETEFDAGRDRILADAGDLVRALVEKGLLRAVA